MAAQVYRPRKPRESPLWKCLCRHFEEFFAGYEQRYQGQYGFLRPVIPDVVSKYLDCGDLERGFARVRCDHCKHEYLLAFSCKGRWWRLPCTVPEGLWCMGPSCHQKKVQLFGELLTSTVLLPIPHRHFTFGLPKLLRPYFRYDRSLLKDLCRIAHDSLLDYMRVVLRMPEGIPGIVMTIHTFGEYLDFHPHLHALVADGLFTRRGMFHVLPEAGLKPLEKVFQARVISFLVRKGLLPQERAKMLLGWKHSGFNLHRSRRVRRDKRDDLGRLAQYIIRNPFSMEKMRVTEPTPESPGGTVIYRSGLNPKIGRNFQIYSPCDFIASITQHIPDKSFQLVRYYGWYSNKMRGQREKKEPAGSCDVNSRAVEVIDVSEDRRGRIPSPKWRELIKKVWEADPLICPKCSSEMRIIALIDERAVIERILRCLGLWFVDRRSVVINMHVTGPPEPKSGGGQDDAEPIWDYASDADPFPDYDTEPVMEYANE